MLHLRRFWLPGYGYRALFGTVPWLAWSPRLGQNTPSTELFTKKNHVLLSNFYSSSRMFFFRLLLANAWKKKKRESPCSFERKGGVLSLSGLGHVHTYPIFFFRKYCFADTKIYASTHSVFESFTAVHTYPIVSENFLICCSAQFFCRRESWNEHAHNCDLASFLPRHSYCKVQPVEACSLSLEKMSKSSEKVKKKYADTYKWTDDHQNIISKHPVNLLSIGCVNLSQLHLSERMISN